MEYCTEAEALSDILDGSEFNIEDLKIEIAERNIFLKKRYELAKNKKVGEYFNCTYCGKKHLKKQYAQAFCPPSKNKKSKCKDRYWNSVDETRWRKTL